MNEQKQFVFHKGDRVEVISNRGMSADYRGYYGTIKQFKKGLAYVQLDKDPKFERPFIASELKLLKRYEIRGTMVILTINLDIPMYNFVSGMFPDYEGTFMLVSELPTKDEIEDEYKSFDFSVRLEEIKEMFKDIAQKVDESGANAVRFI